MDPEDDGYNVMYDKSLSRSDRAKVHHKNFAFQITPNSLLAISQLSRKMTYLQLFRMGVVDMWSLLEALEIPNAGAPPDGANTITDRLTAQTMMGLGTSESPAGRKPTAQSPPSMQVKQDEDGGPRVTISESGS
jgi:hypothetical protein